MSNEQHKPLITINDFIAGGCAGITQVLIGQPLDIIKVRLQTSLTKMSSIEVAKQIYHNEGPLAFYKGTISPLVGMSFAVANQLAGYEMAKRYIAKKIGGDDKLTTKHLVIAGSVGGFFYSLIVSPMELFRIKMQVKGEISYNSSVDAAVKIYKSQGLRGVFFGYNSTAVREIIGSGVWLGVYESCVRTQLSKHNNNRKEIPMWKIVLCGSIGGVAMWSTVFPADIIKSRIQGSNFLTTKYKSFLGTGKIIIQENGFGGLYRGIAPCLARSFIVSGANFYVYENVYLILDKFHI